MDPIQYTEFLANVFESGRQIENIIEKGEGKHFARVLKAAKKDGSASVLMNRYVENIRKAERISLDEKGWISAHSLFQSKARDIEIFKWIALTEPSEVAIDDEGNLYLSEGLSIDFLQEDRRILQLRKSEIVAAIFVLLVFIGLHIFHSHL